MANKKSVLKKYPAVMLGVGITILFIILGFIRMDFLDALEYKLYDIQMEWRGDENIDTDEIILVNIDDESIENLGRWPWPRSYIAKCVNKINAAGAKVIGLNIIYSEPEESDALKELQVLSERLSQMISEPSAIQMINETMAALDNDKKLSEAIKTSDNVVLPVFFKPLQQNQKKTKEKAERLKTAGYTLVNIKNPNNLPCPSADDAVIPVSDFFEASKGVGHVNLFYDPDGKIRREQLLYAYENLYIPSFTLKIAALYQNIPGSEIQGEVGKSLVLRHLEIPMTAKSELLVNFKGGAGAFKRISFYDIYKDKIMPNVLKERLKDKIVLVTPSAAGVVNPLSTPTAQSMSVGEFSANTIWAILHRRFIQQPPWNTIAGLLLTGLVGAVIILILPRLKALFAGLAFAGFFVILIAGSMFLFVSKGLWVQISYPLLQLICGYIGVVTVRYFVTETRQEKIEGESAESNRMLGLSFQSQGMLDMAFEKFRKVPVDDEMKRILYDLARDFERKRQLNKAASVFEYIEEYDPEYRDVGQKKKMLLQASDTMIFGDGFLGGGTQDPLMATTSGVRPTLGRYEVIKQLGKGAMGIVYLGKDPHINRTTAIKTFKFTEDYSPEEIEATKRKFFREAESAGTLSHPNIVTIYDAGSEQDMAYIAMEFLEGEDLQKYTKKNNLLPMRKVLDYVADIADALDYAHQKGIVHRDIKPANVMLLKTGIIKITDFGIARITHDSGTKTGVVKGTPHYMSPEQISGEKVDGRSDIFSLGVMLYQLLTGEVPFRGDNPAALMHQIINVPHPNPMKFNPQLLKPHITIIDKAMAKDRDKRYQRGTQMASHLRMLGKKLDDLAKKKK